MHLASAVYISYAIAASFSVSLVDVLSSSSQFHCFLSSLQRGRLIPLLNGPNANITVIAAANRAFENTVLTNEHLQYHILNGTFPSGGIHERRVVQTIVNEQILSVNIENRNGTLKVASVPTIQQDLSADNGIIHVVNSFLPLPKSFWKVIERHPRLTRLHHLVSNTEIAVAGTVLAPIDDAFSVFSDVEWDYLISQYGRRDARLLVNGITIRKTIYRQDVAEVEDYLTQGNVTVRIIVTEHGLSVNSMEAIEVDVITREAVLHFLPRLLIPNALRFTVSKYLRGLHCDKFADAIDSEGFKRFVDNDDCAKTIFASRSSKTPYGVDYQLVAKAVNHTEDAVLESEFRPASLGGAGQRLILRNGTINGERIIRKLCLGRAIIYEVEEPFSLPFEFSKALAASRDLTLTADGLSKSQLISGLQDLQQATFLLPSNEAWLAHGLATTYFNRNVTAMRDLFRGLIFHGLAYTNSSGAFRSINENYVSLRVDDRGVYMGSCFMPIVKHDQLVSSGVAHIIGELAIPKGMDYGPAHLLWAGNLTIFPQLLARFNLTTTLDMNSNNSILVPTNYAMRRAISGASDDHILSLLKLHILLGQFNWHTSSHETMYQGTRIGFRNVSGISLVHIDGGLSRQVKITQHGITSSGANVFVLDRALDPDWIIGGNTQRRWYWVWGVVGTVGALLAAAFAFVCVWNRRRKQARERADEEPLLSNEPSGYMDDDD